MTSDRQRGFAIAFAIVLTLAMGLVCLDYWHDLRETQRRAVDDLRTDLEGRARQISRAAAREMELILRDSDVALLHLRDAYLESPQQFDSHLHRFLRHYPDEMFRFLVIFDRQGRLSYFNGERGQLGASFADREHFRVHADRDGDEAFVAAPVMGRLTGSPLIQFTRPILDRGRFAGVIGLPLRPEYLARLLNEIGGNDTEIVVLRQDGRVLAHSQQPDRILEFPAHRDQPYLGLQGAAQGLIHSLAQSGKQPQLQVWQRLEGWPVTILVSLNEQTALDKLVDEHASQQRETGLMLLAVFLMTFSVSLMVINVVRSNHRLATEEERFRQMFRANLSVKMIIHPDTGRIIDVNPAACEFYGYSHDQLLEMSITDINCQPPEEVMQEMQRAKDEQRKYFNFRHRLANGDERWVEVYSGPIKTRSGTRLYSIIHDITQRREAELRLRDSEAFKSALLNGTSQAIVATDAQGIITLFNQGAETLLGYRADDVVGQRSPLIFHDPLELRDRADVLSSGSGQTVQGDLNFLLALARRDLPEPAEWTLITRQGRRITVSLTMTHLQDDAGKTLGYVGVAEDISARKQAEADILAAKEAAESANRAKSQFLATMSHEIRTPMNAILGLTEFILDTPLSTTQQTLLEKVRQASLTLLRTLNDILDYARAEAGRIQLAEQAFDPAELAHTSADLFRPRALEKNLELLVDLAPDLPRQVLGDPGRISQILNNLLGNAVKFTDQGYVRLRLTTTRNTPGKLDLHFEVSDTGIGISPTQLAQLFRPFTQADGSINRKYGGSGLGLAISTQLAQAMEGRLEARSEVGQGACFSLDIPVIGLADAQTDTAPSIAPPVQNVLLAPILGARILVVEDHPLNQEVAIGMLERLGLRTSLAGDGKQGLAMALSEPFDAILMDIHMPEMDGLEASRQLHARLGQACPPIIAMTAAVLAEDREQCRQAGMVDFVAKPVDPENLIRALIEAIPPRPARPSPPVATAPSAPIPTPATLAGPDLRNFLLRLRPYLSEGELLPDELENELKSRSREFPALVPLHVAIDRFDHQSALHQLDSLLADQSEGDHGDPAPL